MTEQHINAIGIVCTRARIEAAYKFADMVAMSQPSGWQPPLAIFNPPSTKGRH